MERLGGALLTALVVAGVLLLARHLGPRAAGVLAALPTVTAPTLAWISYERGPAFAAAASIAGVSACAMLAAFAVGYTRAPRRGGSLVALGCGVASAALVAWPVQQASGALWSAVTLAVASCVLALRCMPCPPAADASPLVRTGRLMPTAAAAGTLTAVCASLASTLGSFAAGLLSSLPIISGAVVLVEHGRHGPVAAARFLRGYVGGLFGKAAFGTAFAWLAVHVDAGPALLLACLATGPATTLVARGG